MKLRLLLLLLLCSACFSVFANRKHPLEIELNHGHALTNLRLVQVTLHHPNVHDKAHALVRVGQKPDLSDAQWLPFSKQLSYELQGPDGVLVVYAQTQDSDSVRSQIASTSITLDTQPPAAASLLINNGDQYTNDAHQRVSLQLLAHGATQMQLSHEADFAHHTHWQNYKSSMSHKMHGHEDGVKFIYARFRDEAGNISDTISASITVDHRAPTGTLYINEGDHYAFSQLVYLHIATADDDVDQIRVEGHRTQVFDFEAIPGKEEKTMLQVWWLDSIQGNKVIRVYFRDFAGNVSKVPVEDYINLQLDHPEIPMLTINNNKRFTTQQQGKVNLRIGTREDDIRGYHMMLSNREDFEGAEKVPLSRVVENWQLDTVADGEKTVYLKVFNEAGSASEAASKSIVLHRSKPKGLSLSLHGGATCTNQKVVDVEVQYEDATHVQFNNAASFIHVKKWHLLSDSLSGWPIAGIEGANTVYARFKDAAGNISEPISASIRYDSKAPKGIARIVNAAQLQEDPAQPAQLEFRYTEDAQHMMLSNQLDFSAGCTWVPVASAMDWSIEGLDQQFVYFRFRDEAGNISKPGRIVLMRPADED